MEYKAQQLPKELRACDVYERFEHRRGLLRGPASPPPSVVACAKFAKVGSAVYQPVLQASVPLVAASVVHAAKYSVKELHEPVEAETQRGAFHAHSVHLGAKTVGRVVAASPLAEALVVVKPHPNHVQSAVRDGLGVAESHT